MSTKRIRQDLARTQAKLRRLEEQLTQKELDAKAVIADAVLAHMVVSDQMRTWLRTTVAAMSGRKKDALRDGLSEEHVEVLFGPGEESGDG